MSILCVTLSLLLAEPVVLDNGAIRVEIDPQVFSVRYVGVPGGHNYLDPMFVSQSDRTSGEWVDPGGLVTDLVPLKGHDAAVRRGPAEVLERRPDYVALVSPASKRWGVRVKKEIRLDATEAKARYTVTVSVTGSRPVRCAVRNTVRVAPDVTLRVEKSDGRIRVLAGAKAIYPAVVNSNWYWLIPIPPTSPMNHVVLGAFVPKIILQSGLETWTRRIVAPPAEATAVPKESSFLCLLDDGTHSYGAALQGATTVIRPASPLVFEEEWTLEKLGH